MKVTLPLGLLLLVAAAIGYAFGTEVGRAQRDVILVKMGRKQDALTDPGVEEPGGSDDAEGSARIEA